MLSKKNFKVLFDALGCPMIHCAPDGAIREANNLAIKILKLEPINYIGSNLFEYCRKKHYSLGTLGDKQSTAVITTIKESYHLDKEIVCTISWKKILFSSLEDDTLLNDDFLIIGYDITPEQTAIDNYHNMEAALHKTKIAEAEAKRLDNLIKYTPDMLYWKDKNSIYLGCNEQFAKLAGYNHREEIIGKSDYELSWGEGADNYILDDQEVIHSEKPKLDIEETIFLANGEKAIVLTNKVPLHNLEGEVVGILGISKNITNRKRMEEELSHAKKRAEAANHAKSEFIANISHDMRSPLTGIITFSRYLKDQEKLSVAARKELAGDTYYASEQLLNLLNGVLDLVSADSATDNDLNLKSFNLLEMINDLIQLEKPAVKSHHLELRQSIDENIPRFIVSDKMKLHRILLNLIGNAIKFTEKGYIKLSATLQSKDKKEATVIFSVEDTGIGIPEEANPKFLNVFIK